MTPVLFRCFQQTPTPQFFLLGKLCRVKQFTQGPALHTNRAVCWLVHPGYIVFLGWMLVTHNLNGLLQLSKDFLKELHIL